MRLPCAVDAPAQVGTAVADAEQLAQVAAHHVGPMGEEAGEGLLDLGRTDPGGLDRRRVDHDAQPPVARQLARPVDDAFLGVGIQIALAERERIQGVEELGDVLDPYLDRLGRAGAGHGVQIPSSQYGRGPNRSARKSTKARTFGDKCRPWG